MCQHSDKIVLCSSGGQGRFTLDFDHCRKQGNLIQVVAGTCGVWEFAFSVKGAPIKAGGGILIRRYRASWFGSRMQTDDPRQDDYVSCAGSSGAELGIEIVNIPYAQPFWCAYLGRRAVAGLLVKVKKGVLKLGETVKVSIGLRRPGLMTVVPNLRNDLTRRDTPKHKIEVYVDCRGHGVYRKIKRELICRILSARPGRLLVAADSIVAESNKFRAVIRAEDVYGNLCSDYRGKVSVSGDNVADLPNVLNFKEKHKGVCEIKGRICATGKSARVYGTDGKLNGIGNPMRNAKLHGKYNLYWGELHCHTNLSHDGRGDINAAYRFGRDAARLDFCAITNHTIQQYPGTRLSPKTAAWWQNVFWKEHRQAAMKFYAPGRYVPVLAQECHPADGGDHNIYCADYRAPLALPVRTRAGAVEEQKLYRKLYREVNAHRALIVPHVGGGAKSWDYHDAEAEPLLEVASIHGRFESFAQAAFQRGYRMGMVFGSDFHCGTPGSGGYIVNPSKLKMPRNHSAQFAGGLTAVLAEELTLDAVIAALREKRCYAVTGQGRMIVEFRIDDQVVGREFTTKNVPTICVSVLGHTQIRSIALVRNTAVIHEHRGATDREMFTLTDPGIPSGWNYYYLRIIQENDDLGWAGPIWVNYRGKTRPNRRRVIPWDRAEVTRLDQLGKNAADRYEKQVVRHLGRLVPGRFYGLKGVRVADNSYGRYALFFGYDRQNHNAQAKFMYFLDFDYPCVLPSYHWKLFETEIWERI